MFLQLGAPRPLEALNPLPPPGPWFWQEGSRWVVRRWGGLCDSSTPTTPSLVLP